MAGALPSLKFSTYMAGTLPKIAFYLYTVYAILRKIATHFLKNSPKPKFWGAVNRMKLS